MRSIFKKGLFIAVACLYIGNVHAVTIFESDLLQTGSGYTTAGQGSYSTSAVSWASAYSNYWKTTSSTNKTTLTFSPALDLSNYSNVQMTVYWGHTSSGKPIRIYVNNTEITSAASGTMTASASNTLYTAVVNISGNSISTIAFQGKSSSGLHVFHFAITGENSGGGGDIAVTGVTLNKTATSIVAGQTEQLTATVAPGNATNKNVTWESNKTSVATVDQSGKITAVAAGTATITVKTVDGNKTATCAVTVTPASSDPIAVTGVTLNKSNTSLNVGGTETLIATVAPGNATNKSVTWESNKTSVATVDQSGKITAIAEGTATITVKTVDGNKTATCAVTVTAAPPTPPTPSTDLTTHVPEIYEAKGIAGYGGELTVINGREYEVYYMTRDAESKFCIATTNADKTKGITTRTTNDYSCAANDGWFRFSGKAWSSSSDAMGAEFGTMARRLDMDNTNEFTMHVSGFDEFAIVARDKKKDTSSGQTKPGDNKYLEVYVNDVLQAQQFNASPSIRRYTIPTAGCVVRIKHIGGDNSSMYAFSLRVAQEPRTKYLDGNDSTQKVLVTQPIQPIVYTTKYNNIAGAETKLVWIGEEATGITLSKTAGSLSDTLTLTGQANCPAGTYNYAVVAYYNNVETNRINGKFFVENRIKALTDTIVDAYVGEEMDEIQFRMYVAGHSWNFKYDTWPDGIDSLYNSTTNILSIGGTPTQDGTYEMVLKVQGDSVHIKINVKPLNLGDNPVMYLYKNSNSYNNDGVYTYLTSGSTPIANLIERKANSAPRSADQYAKYKWILISEDVDADNPEVLAIIRDKSSNLPILNMKSFTYAADRLNWGEPNNGTMDTVSKNGGNIFIVQPEHPIFKNLNGAQGTGKLQVLTKTDNKKGVMPIDINKCDGSLCLATAYTRNRDNYFQDGELQTVIHEIPAAQRNGRKYICFRLPL